LQGGRNAAAKKGIKNQGRGAQKSASNAQKAERGGFRLTGEEEIKQAKQKWGKDGRKKVSCTGKQSLNGKNKEGRPGDCQGGENVPR